MRNKHEDSLLDRSALQMREATITTGVWLTLLIGVTGELYVALTWARPHRTLLAILFLLSALAAVTVMLLPREQLVRSRLREPFFLSWTVLDLAMLVAGTLADGGTASPLVLLFFVPIVFSSMSYPLGSVVAVGLLSIISYLAVALLAGGSSAVFQGGFVLALVCTGAMSAWQARNHNRQHRALADASHTDPLTGCLNRRGFEERANEEIDAMQHGGRPGAIAMLDIDHFKPVNDRFGHAAGDELLCWVTRRIGEAIRPVDELGRVGGDEFAILLRDVDVAQAGAIVARIDAALRERAPASLGLALFPGDAGDLEGLTRCADARLYGSRSARPKYAHSSAPRERRGAVHDATAPGIRTPPDSAAGAQVDGGLVDAIDASVIVTDLTGQVLRWNSGAERLYGWSSTEAVGRNARELMVPDDARAAEELKVEVSREGRWDGELLVRRKDGSLFDIYVRNRLVLDEHGTPAAIVGVAVDISARVAAERELLQSRNYAQAVTECIGEGMFTIDVGGCFGDVNPTAESLLGWTGGELRGRPVDVILPALGSGEGKDRFQVSAMRDALTRSRTVRAEDALFLTRDGAEVPVAYTAAPFHTDDGMHAGCVVIFRDVSERKRREAEQRRDAATLACLDRVELALAEDRLVLHAQPIVDLRTGRTVQHELLLRMREPDGRIVPPGEFLPAAEKYALIGDVDLWVIKNATQIAGTGCPVQLNISARSVVDHDFLAHIERCIEQCAVAPGTLVFEITETAIVEDEEAARMFAERLHALGCKVALDDFGTGYGTLTYLKYIPVDYLKLDIEFVRDLTTNSASHHVVQAVVALARDFDLQTVAEGVEEAGALEILSRLGVDFVQGYHLGRPAPFAVTPGDLCEPVGIPARGGRRANPRRPRRLKVAATRPRV